MKQNLFICVFFFVYCNVGICQKHIKDTSTVFSSEHWKKDSFSEYRCHVANMLIKDSLNLKGKTRRWIVNYLGKPSSDKTINIGNRKRNGVYIYNLNPSYNKKRQMIIRSTACDIELIISFESDIVVDISLTQEG